MLGVALASFPTGQLHPHRPLLGRSQGISSREGPLGFPGGIWEGQDRELAPGLDLVNLHIATPGYSGWPNNYGWS